jgi:hypothetical protein
MLEPPLVLNPDPEAEIAEMLRFELPVFVRVINCAVDEPTSTFPKLRLEVLTESTAPAVGGVVLPLEEEAVVDVLPAGFCVNPAQPTVPSVASKVIAKTSLRTVESDGSAGSPKPCTSFPGFDSERELSGLEPLGDYWTGVHTWDR